MQWMVAHLRLRKLAINVAAYIVSSAAIAAVHLASVSLGTYKLLTLVLTVPITIVMIGVYCVVWLVRSASSSSFITPPRPNIWWLEAL